MVMGCIHLAFTLGLFSLGGERVARERRESDQLDCSRDSDQLDRSLSRLLPQTLLPNAKGTHSSTSIACLLDQSRGKLPPPFVIDLVDLLRWRRIYSRGTRASPSLSQRSSPVPNSGLPGTSRSTRPVQQVLQTRTSYLQQQRHAAPRAALANFGFPALPAGHLHRLCCCARHLHHQHHHVIDRTRRGKSQHFVRRASPPG